MPYRSLIAWLSNCRSAHRSAEGLLPWYANGSLDSYRMGCIASHVRECPCCAEDLQILEAYQGELKDPDLPDHLEANLSRMMAAIDRYEAEAVEESRRASARPKAAWWVKLAQCVRLQPVSPASPSWALAFGLVALSTIVSFERVPDQHAATASFHTLGAAQAESGAEARELQVVFAPTLSRPDIDRLIASVRAEWVAGPSDIGVYTVRTATSADGRQNVTTREVAQQLRQDPNVILAEPIRPTQ